MDAVKFEGSFRGVSCTPPPETSRANGNGYYRDRKTDKYTHRIAYEKEFGPIPDKLQVDHLCRNRWCSNAMGGHIEAVTARVNTLRGFSPPALNARSTVCTKGHEYAVRANGHRFCPTCRYVLRQGYGEISARGRKVDRTHCPQGHEYTPANTYICKRGCRYCRTCQADRAQARRLAKV